MRIQKIIGEGIHALGSNKLRTFFMTVGTIVGIAALTIVMSVGAGTEKKIMQRVENFGIRAIMVTAGGGKGFSPPQGGITTLRMEDADAIRDQIDGIEIVTPAALKRNMSIKAGDRQIQATVFAGEPDWHDAWSGTHRMAIPSLPKILPPRRGCAFWERPQPGISLANRVRSGSTSRSAKSVSWSKACSRGRT